MRDRIRNAKGLFTADHVPPRNNHGTLAKDRMEDFVRILAVAPYEGLAAILEREARSYHNVSMTVVVGNLEEGLAAAIEQLVEPYDLILSRGGTADLLRENLDIPVVDIKTSAYDVLQAVQLSEDIQGKRAVVGFAGITDAARSTNDALHLDLDIFTLVDEDDARQITSLLSKEGYTTVLCDVISSTVFREHGFNTVLVTSSAASVRASIDEAIRTTHYIRDARIETQFLREVIRGHAGDTVVFRDDGRLFYTTLDKGGAEALLSLLKDLLGQVMTGEIQTVRRSIGGTQYVIRTLVTELPGRTMVTFYITHGRISAGQRQAGVTFFTQREARAEFLESPYSLTGDINGIRQVIESVTRAAKPLLITGEYGTGRTAVASYAYFNSIRSSHPLVEIDCGMLTDRSREFLLSGRTSPLFADGLTLHIKNMEASPAPFLSDLLSTIAGTDGARRCSLIFSCNPRGEQVSANISYIKDKFQCMEVELPPLRENKERIPTIAKLCLSQLNADLPQEVLRIDRQAMTLLSDYPWPGNYIQFKRVLSQLCVISRDHTIRAQDVRSLLAQERPVYPNISDEESPYGIDLNRTLAEIERDIIEAAIQRHNGNQSAAARQLGISRTTLWRMTKG